jgi:cysteine synthase
MKLIGNTPLCRLRSIEPEGVELWAKMEDRNLSGSIKARPAWQMMQSATKSGQLSSGQTLLEPTSGNTGIALAALARRHEMRFCAVVPENATAERVELLRIYGAEIIFSPAPEGSNGAIRLAEEVLGENPDWVHLDQYSNPANAEAHFLGTGPEIWSELPSITHFVAGLGTGGTLMGTGRFLRSQKADVQIVAAEPMPGEAVQGLRSLEEGYVPPLLRTEELDRRILVRSGEAIAAARMFLREGIFAGISAGANLSVALRIASPGDKIALVVPDGGERYLSTGAFSEDAPEEMDLSSWW